MFPLPLPLPPAPSKSATEHHGASSDAGHRRRWGRGSAMSPAALANRVLFPRSMPVASWSVANPDALGDAVLWSVSTTSPVRRVAICDPPPECLAVCFAHLGFQARLLLHNVLTSCLGSPGTFLIIVNCQLPIPRCLLSRPPSTTVSTELGSDRTGGGSGISTLSKMRAR